MRNSFYRSKSEGEPVKKAETKGNVIIQSTDTLSKRKSTPSTSSLSGRHNIITFSKSKNTKNESSKVSNIIATPMTNANAVATNIPVSTSTSRNTTSTIPISTTTKNTTPTSKDTTSTSQNTTSTSQNSTPTTTTKNTTPTSQSSIPTTTIKNTTSTSQSSIPTTPISTSTTDTTISTKPVSTSNTSSTIPIDTSIPSPTLVEQKPVVFNVNNISLESTNIPLIQKTSEENENVVESENIPLTPDTKDIPLPTVNKGVIPTLVSNPSFRFAPNAKPNDRITTNQILSPTITSNKGEIPNAYFRYTPGNPTPYTDINLTHEVSKQDPNALPSAFGVTYQPPFSLNPDVASTEVTTSYTIPSSAISVDGVIKKDELERDIAYMKHLYPTMAKIISHLVIEECNKLDYEGSLIYDDYPDKTSLDLIADRIYDTYIEGETAAELEVVNLHRNHRRHNNNLRDVISLILLNEIFDRRRCHRNRRHCH